MTGKELNKWADDFMFEAEPSKASDGVKAYLLGAPVDPLGQIAACVKMYKGEVVRDLRDVTDAERREVLEQMSKTVLKMPLEAVSFHFMVEGVHRGITHQIVRQRTAAFAQESTRFAVKRDMRDATALPPSLQGTKSLGEVIDDQIVERRMAGLRYFDGESEFIRAELMEGNGGISEDQHRRLKWDEAVEKVSEVYNALVDGGMAAEEARGLMPTNITTRLNYITNLRSFLDYMAVRVGDQAQFEWRELVAAYARAMREYGQRVEYDVRMTAEQYDELDAQDRDTGECGVRKSLYIKATWPGDSDDVIVTFSSSWQYEAIMAQIKPVEFQLSRRAFGANFDRPSRIGERIDAFAKMGITSERWTSGAPEYNIPAIHPDEWLLDPNAARLDSSQEFDIFGNRVPKGTGWHWRADDGGELVSGSGQIGHLNKDGNGIHVVGLVSKEQDA